MIDVSQVWNRFFTDLKTKNIMTTREVLIEELGEQRVKELDDRALLALVEWAMIQYHEKQVKNCSIPAVSGRSEQLVCCENCTYFDKQEKTFGKT